MRAWIFVALLGLAACHGETAPAPPPAPSAEFTADDPVTSASVFLRGQARGDQIIVDVIARGVPDVHGTAFRLTFDPAVLSYVEVNRGQAFSSGAMNVTKEAKPGELMAAWTETGGTGFAANDETILGSLTFDVKARAQTTAMAFRGERSTLIDRKGKAAALAWRGGAFALK